MPMSEAQAEVLRLRASGMTRKQIADHLGISLDAVKDRIRRAKQWQGVTQGQEAAMEVSGLDVSNARHGWRVIKHANGSRDSVFWKAEEGEEQEGVLDAIRDAFESLTPAEPVSAPEAALSDLCTTYCIADAHLGLRAWHKETGSDYDTDIAAARIKDWVGQCVASSPASHTGIILDVGDYTHANDDTYQTPNSKHVLDVDTRMFRTLDVGIPTLAAAVDLALTKHREVRVVILPGNHNPMTYLAVMFALAERYRNEPRVIVHKEPGEFFVFEFGKVMIASHHGDKAKADRLVHFIADEYAEMWGRTRYRFLFTGHLHHHKSQDIGGMKWEQLRAVADRDAYAVSHAYAARAQLSAVTYHRERGEVQRVSVTAA